MKELQATNGRVYYVQGITDNKTNVQFTDAHGTRHSFTPAPRLLMFAIYEDATAAHFCGLMLVDVRNASRATLWIAPFVKRFTFGASDKVCYMRKYALDGSGVAVPESRKMHNNRVAAQARRERERARFAYAHAARAHK